MEEELQKTTPKGLWLLVVVPLVILAISMEASFVLVRQACSAQRNVALYAVMIVAIALTLALALFAFALWKAEGTRWPSEAVDVSTRIRFIAVLGLLASGISLLVLVGQGIATVLFNPCQL
jgi:ABC-type Na+ efflux pump permease subunit